MEVSALPGNNMISVPVLVNTDVDILQIQATLKRGSGEILISGLFAEGIEDEITKAIRFCTELADLEEFKFPNLTIHNLIISFSCKLSELPVDGRSYGLGLAVELLRVFSRRSFRNSTCYTGLLLPDGKIGTVRGFQEKLNGAAKNGFSRAFVPASQLDFFNSEISQIPIDTIYEAWTRLVYEDA